jgi:MoxR-like ATPase
MAERKATDEAAEKIAAQSAFLRDIQSEIAGVVVGQEALVRRLLIGLLADGHILLEGVPGLAKTLLVSTLATTLSVTFRRIQFTPDLLPSDVTGTPSTTPRRASSPSGPAPSSPTSCWPTRSTAPPPRCRARCWRRCRSGR